MNNTVYIKFIVLINMLLVKGFNKLVIATKENNSLEITKYFRFVTSLTISLFLGFSKVVNNKVNNR